jgi:RND family efflux transporter MFP subunit
MAALQSTGTFASRFRLIKTAASATTALAALALFLAWMGGAFHEKVKPGVVPVERPSAAGRTLVTIERTVETETIAAVGSAQPHRKTEVASQLLATIREIKVRPGDHVKAGDLLITLDDRELTAQQHEAIESLASAEADLVTRKSDYERIKSVRGTGSVSAEEFARVEGALRVTEAQVRRAKETINRIDVQLTHARISAATDGLVADRFADPSDLAMPGKPLLVLYDPNDLELQVNVPESLAAGITIGQSLAVRIDANNLSTTARIREIVPQAQQASRSVLVKLGLPQSSTNPILPGMYGRAAIPTGQIERIWVPRDAVFRFGQLDLIEVAEDDGALSRRFVRIGRELDGKFEVLSGLTTGERVALPAKK